MIFDFIFSILLFLQINAVAIEIYQYKDAIEVSRNTNKKVYVLFTKEKCTWCDKQKETHNNPDVINLLKQSYIVTYVDIGKEPEIGKRYGIRSVPTNVIIDFEEKVEKKTLGYKNKDSFIKWLD